MSSGVPTSLAAASELLGRFAAAALGRRARTSHDRLGARHFGSAARLQTCPPRARRRTLQPLVRCPRPLSCRPECGSGMAPDQDRRDAVRWTARLLPSTWPLGGRRHRRQRLVAGELVLPHPSLLWQRQLDRPRACAAALARALAPANVIERCMRCQGLARSPGPTHGLDEPCSCARGGGGTRVRVSRGAALSCGQTLCAPLHVLLLAPSSRAGRRTSPCVS